MWVKDPAIAEVMNGTDYVFKDGVTRKVAAVSIKPGDEEIPFRIRGAADKVGSSTEVFMAATPTNVYNSAGTLLTNFTWRTIRVVEPPPPGMAVDSIKRISPPAIVQARPVTTPGMPLLKTLSWLILGRPR